MTLLMQTPDEVPGASGAPVTLAPAYQFDLVTLDNPSGFEYQAEVSFSVGDDAENPESETTLRLSGLRGLSMRDGMALARSRPFVQLLAGFLDPGLQKPTTVFYGQVQDMRYGLEAGALVWTVLATGRPIALYEKEVRARFSGRKTVGEIWPAVCQKLGLRGEVADDEAAAVEVTDWNASGTGRVELSRLALAARADIKARTGVEPKLVPTQASLSGDAFRFDMVRLGAEGQSPQVTLDLDQRGIHSAGPVQGRGEELPSELSEEPASTIATSKQDFVVASDFDPRIGPGFLVAASSKKHGIGVGFAVERYKHAMGSGASWRTEFAGLIQVDRSIATEAST